MCFTCKLIHLFDDLFRASHFNHRLPGLVADESVVDAVILLFMDDFRFSESSHER